MHRQNNKVRKSNKLIEGFHNSPIDINILIRVVLIIFLLFILREQIHHFLFRTEYELDIQSLGNETFMPSLHSAPKFHLRKD